MEITARKCKKRKKSYAQVSDHFAPKLQYRYDRLNCLKLHIFRQTGNSAIQFIVDTNENDKSTAPKSGAITNSKGHFVKKSFAASLGDARFQFNFPVDAIEKLSLDASNETNVRVAQPPENTSQAENTSVKEKQTKNAVDTTSKVQLGPFAKTKLESSDNSFKFNFAIE